MEDQLILAIITFFLSVSGWLKSHSEIQSVKRDRESTKVERDTRMAVVEQKNVELEKRLDAGETRFSKIEDKLDKTNMLLSQLVGMFKATLRAKSHQPEDL